MRKTLITLALVAAMAGTAMADELQFKVSSFYESSSNWNRAVITTNKSIMVQCSGMDKDGNPLNVSTRTQINPPMDEVMVRNTNEVVSVRCWVAK